MMNTKEELKAFEEAVFTNAEQWESRELGADEAFVRKSVNPKRKRAVSNNMKTLIEKLECLKSSTVIEVVEDTWVIDWVIDRCIDIVKQHQLPSEVQDD